KNEKYDIVIMDLTIRGAMGGKEAVREVLNIDKDAYCIVTSGYSKDPVMSNYKEYGFKSAIKKPFTIVELSKVLRT
ncbi:MAG: response regulator, partial [Thermodesulfovibrionales bacterium]|nr:response regulator [Thermodesulfovibrionales bacterium]